MDFQGTVVFGGAFDPPHLGHVDCLKILYKAFPTVTTVVIPASVPPSVEDSQVAVKRPMVKWQDRHTMCRLTFGSYFPTNRVLVSDIESKLPEPNFSINTIDYFIRSGLSDLALLLGWDQFALFHKWHRVKELLQKAGLIIIGRNDLWDPETAMKNFEERLNLGYEWGPDRKSVKLGTGRNIFFLKGETSPVSSRALREKLKTDVANVEAIKYLEPETYEYISKHKLYR
jgi:nicotinate (nicotinamide) nucleotide adenylyltransferase